MNAELLDVVINKVQKLDDDELQLLWEWITWREYIKENPEPDNNKLTQRELQNLLQEVTHADTEDYGR